MLNTTTRRVLGRGLADLIPVVGGDAAAAAADKKPTSLEATRDAPIATIHANPTQPRTRFDETALAELADSVRTNGILQPILVRPRKAGGYEIVAGERRYRAALRAGLRTVPVVVRDLSDADTLALALIENLIREDIGPLESARAFQRLMADFGWTQEEMGTRVGKSRSAVANARRLLTRPPEIPPSVERGELSEGHARTLIGDEKQRAHPAFSSRQLALWRDVVAKGLSVREVERRMRGAEGSANGDGGSGAAGETITFADTRGKVPTSAKSASDEKRAQQGERADFAALEDRLRDALGTQIRLVGTTDRGRLEIEYFSAGELDDLIGKIERS